MKQLLLFVVMVSVFSRAHTQDINAFFAEPQVIELSISSPQPRLNETFKITLDAEHLRANIFKSLMGKVRLSDGIEDSHSGELTMDVVALHRGKNEIGPLEFTLDKTKYTTNRVVFEVVDPLPNTDNGLWLRKVATSDSTFCIIIEQRIPAKSKTTVKDNSTTFTTEPEHEEIVKFKYTYSIEGLSNTNSQVNTSFSSVEINGEDKQFMYGYSVYYFRITDKKKKIKITSDKFENLPAGYKFEDIIIQ